MLPKFALATVATAILAYAAAPMVRRLVFMLPAASTQKTNNPLKVGLVGAADIAKFAVLWPASREPSIVVHAVAARDEQKAKAYASKHGIPKVHANYQDLMMDSEIDVIYVGVITELHYAITKFALQQNKHVLLEKPAVFLQHEANKLVVLANQQGKVLFEAFHWRYHPAAIRVQELMGEVGSLESMELKASLYDPKASSAAEQGAAKQFVKWFDRWCYLIDEMHYYLPKDQWSIEIESVEMKSTMMYANLTATPLETPDLEKGEGGSMPKPVSITMEAYKDKLEVPSWYLSFKGSSGTMRYDNVLFPFIYHRITKPNGEIEKRYTISEDEEVGKTTFAYQLDEFVRLVHEKDASKLAQFNGALHGSMTRNAQIAEKMVQASDATPVTSWTYPQEAEAS